MFAHTVEIAAAGRNGQDRAVAIEREDGLVIAVADGAGGTGSGSTAAQAIVDAAAELGAKDAGALLARADVELGRFGGQSTAVLLAIDAHGIRGASVGDSEAWIVRGRDIVDLTERQHRNPLVGDGCLPVGFQIGALAGGTLVVASDGLFRYAKRDAVVRLVRDGDLRAAGRALVELVRLPTGELQDDVAIVLCRELR